MVTPLDLNTFFSLMLSLSLNEISKAKFDCLR